MEFETKVQSILKNDLQTNVKATLFPILIAEFSTLSSHLPTSLPLPSLLRLITEGLGNEDGGGNSEPQQQCCKVLLLKHTYFSN